MHSGLLTALLAAAALIFFVQGLRMARDRQRLLEPARAATVIEGAADAPEATLPTSARFVAVELGSPPPARVGLYQLFPQRSLVRWVEPSEGTGTLLVLPLRGLEPGHYALTRASASTSAQPRELDRPREELDILARFAISAPPD